MNKKNQFLQLGEDKEKEVRGEKEMRNFICNKKVANNNETEFNRKPIKIL